MHYSFCTYFDSNYACLGISLYHSLKKHCKEFELYVCCLDDRIFNILTELNLSGMILFKLSDVEVYDPEFAESKNNRTIVEYYFTLSPVLPRFLFSQYPDIKTLTYLDSDLYFFSSPDPVFEEFGDSSLSLINHRFPADLLWREKYGKYNLAFQIYRNDSNTAECLAWWREKCIEWCYDRVEKSRFADQKYLEEWGRHFKGVYELKYPGINIAPWNWSNCKIDISDSNLPKVNENKLIFYHYQGVRVLGRHFLFHNQGSYGKVMPKNQLKFFYGKYFKALKEAEKMLRQSKNYDGLSMMSNNRRGGYGYGLLRSYLSALKNKNLMLV